MTINGKELDFKISNLKDAGNFEMASMHMDASEEEIKKLGDKAGISTTFAKTIEAFQKFFIEATGVDVLEGCGDLQEAIDVFNEFVEEVKQQKELLLRPFSTKRIV